MKSHRKITKLIFILSLTALSLTSCHYLGLQMNNNLKNPELEDNITYTPSGRKRPAGNIALMEKQTQDKLAKIQKEAEEARRKFLLSDPYPDFKDVPTRPDNLNNAAELKAQMKKDFDAANPLQDNNQANINHQENITNTESKSEVINNNINKQIIDNKESTKEEAQLLFDTGKIAEQPLPKDARTKAPLMYDNATHQHEEINNIAGTDQNITEPKVDEEIKQAIKEQQQNHYKLESANNADNNSIINDNSANYVAPVAPRQVQAIIPESRYKAGN